MAASSKHSRPVKRRKLDPSTLRSRRRQKLPTPSRSDHSVSDLASHTTDEDASEPELPPISKASDDSIDSPEETTRQHPRIHVPKRLVVHEDTFVTQLTQPPSSPSRIRGPRWKKRVTPDEDSESEPEHVAIENAAIDVTTYVDDQPRIENSHPASAADFNAMLEEHPDFFDDLEETIIDDMATTGAAAGSSSAVVREPPREYRQITLFGHSASSDSSATQQRSHNWPLAGKTETPTHHDLDTEAMKTWVYPTNLGSIRDYQFNVTQRGLFHNLLVALPTGLGKTFVAATIMLNWYRWTRNSQIVFVAPTKPLVAQQVEACFNVVGIPRSDTSMLTGNVSPGLRAQEWLEKRIFFMTPQTLLHDLSSGICDPKKLVLLVVDEAHRATGNYAYVEVVRFLRRFNTSFRVLALTATPGSSVETVQNVIDGLGISRVEIRTEESLDIRQYVHRRNIELEIFEYSDELTMSMDLFSKALQPIVNKLNSQNAYWGKDPMTLTAYGLTKARQQWMASDTGRKAPHGLKSMVNTIFSLLASQAHAIDLLKYHGIGSFYRSLLSFKTETLENKRSGKYANEICNNEHFKKLMNRLQAWINNPDFVGHPKLSFLKQIVLNHFMDAGAGIGAAGGRPPSDTRIMVFVHFRDSAEEVTRILKRHEPMIRPHVFVGQSGSKGSEGMDQKTQLDIIQKFKAGVYNTIVATSIGEEGLDIGEVDLIVCYDSSSSPIRMLQRMGRTGRKRAGNIYLLLMKGKEEDSYVKAKDNYEKMQTMIADGSRFVFHDNLSPRIVPKEIQPVVDKRFIEIPIENTQSDLPVPKKGRRAPKKPPKKFHMPDGVIDGFVKASRLNGDRRTSLSEEEAEPDSPRPERLEPAPLPSLERVLLTSAEEALLEEHYCNVGGDSPQFVHVPNLGAFPTLQRTSFKTDRVPHSRSAMSLTRAFTGISPLADKLRPNGPVAFSQPEQCTSLFISQVSESETIGAESPAAELSSQVSLLFRKPSSRDPKVADQGTVSMESRFYISQEAKEDEFSAEEDLPDMEHLLRRASSGDKENRGTVTLLKPMANRRGRVRKRRLILDDEDDE